MRLKTLNGAPLCEHLDFSDTSLLGEDQCRSSLAELNPNASSLESTLPLKWRSITNRATRLRTGWSQPYLSGSSRPHDGESIALTIPNLVESPHCIQNEQANLDETLTLIDPSFQTDDFVQHSLIFHNALLSSQVLQDAGTGSFVSPSSFLDTSFASTTSYYESPSRVDEHTLLLRVPPQMTITPLGSLPTAQHLNAIYPQTPTPNLVCVLTGSPVQRQIFVQKGGYTRNLWEIFVADETRSGFKVNFWIQPPRKSNRHQVHAQDALCRVLGTIKIGDILLLRNIALNSYRDTVYGQSLSAAFTRARSSIDILMKSNGIEIAHTGGLPRSAVEAFVRVRKWARTHIASEMNIAGKRKRSVERASQHSKRAQLSQDHDGWLPPDTMESV